MILLHTKLCSHIIVYSEMVFRTDTRVGHGGSTGLHWVMALVDVHVFGTRATIWHKYRELKSTTQRITEKYV